MDMNRKADLHYAFQFGQDFVKTSDPKVADEFAVKFAGDTEAQSEFDRGVAHEKARQAQRH